MSHAGNQNVVSGNAAPGNRGQRANAATTVIDADRVTHMRKLLPAQTSESIRETFAISYETWTKIKAGLPIRTSIANRLSNRIAILDQHSK